MIALAELIFQFDTSDRAMRIPDDIKDMIVHKLCCDYADTMSPRMRRFIMRSAITGLKRRDLVKYADVVRIAML